MLNNGFEVSSAINLEITFVAQIISFKLALTSQAMPLRLDTLLSEPVLCVWRGKVLENDKNMPYVLAETFLNNR